MWLVGWSGTSVSDYSNTSWLHPLSWNLRNSHLSWLFKPESSVAISSVDLRHGLDKYHPARRNIRRNKQIMLAPIQLLTQPPKQNHTKSWQKNILSFDLDLLASQFLSIRLSKLLFLPNTKSHLFCWPHTTILMIWGRESHPHI